MSIWRGNSLSMEIYGESHATAVGVKLTGIPPLRLDVTALQAFLERRRAVNPTISTPRNEPDRVVFLNGYKQGVLSESVVAEIANTNVKRSDYEELYGKPRPSHADYVAYAKYGTLDFSGGGRFSGRLTAPFCIAGGIAKQALAAEGISVLSYVQSVGTVSGRSYRDGAVSLAEIRAAQTAAFPSLSASEAMTEEIACARADGDSVGGVAECIAYGVPIGLGGDYAEGLEGELARLLYAIPAVKGVEFGDGFALTAMRGSVANDPLCYRDGTVVTETNRSGGINGGIANGMPVTVRVAFRPTPSVSVEQRTVDLVKKRNTRISIKGRHDACIVPRALPVVESAVSLVLWDYLLSRRISLS